MAGQLNLLTRVGRGLYGEWFIPSLAAALEVNERTVQRWVSGKAYPPRGVWNDLATLLGASELGREIRAKLGNAEKAPDGNWYMRNPNGLGYIRVQR